MPGGSGIRVTSRLPRASVDVAERLGTLHRLSHMQKPFFPDCAVLTSNAPAEGFLFIILIMTYYYDTSVTPSSASSPGTITEFGIDFTALPECSPNSRFGTNLAISK